jgi:tetratricopeptide (TPR) repeat protein
MKGTWVKVVALVVALTLCGAGMAFAAKAKKAEAEFDVTKALIESYTLIEAKKYDKAQKLLDKVLAKDPGNPLALNNLASVMVAMKKFDKADTLLNQALPKAKGYMIQVNRVCTVGNICMAFKPVAGGTGNQDLEPLVKMNIEMVKGMMTASPIPGKGLR